MCRWGFFYTKDHPLKEVSRELDRMLNVGLLDPMLNVESPGRMLDVELLGQMLECGLVAWPRLAWSIEDAFKSTTECFKSTTGYFKPTIE